MRRTRRKRKPNEAARKLEEKGMLPSKEEKDDFRRQSRMRAEGGYSPRNVFEAVAIGHETWVPLGLGSPTGHRPGSADKVDVLVDRLEKGLELWHDNDASADSVGEFEWSESFGQRHLDYATGRKAREDGVDDTLRELKGLGSRLVSEDQWEED